MKKEATKEPVSAVWYEVKLSPTSTAQDFSIVIRGVLEDEEAKNDFFTAQEYEPTNSAEYDGVFRSEYSQLPLDGKKAAGMAAADMVYYYKVSDGFRYSVQIVHADADVYDGADIAGEFFGQLALAKE